MPGMRRREFITLLGGAAAAWPLAARAQQPAMPVVGFLGSTSPDLYAHLVRAYRQGLSEAGYDEGRNVAIDFRWAESQYERLPALATELVDRRVTVIAAGALPAAVTAKAATTTIPIVFSIGVDPVAFGLVASLNRPGGNVTGVTNLNLELGPKQLEVLRELLPAATVMAALVNPTNPNADSHTSDLQTAARKLGIQLQILHASSERDFETVFTSLVQARASGLVIGADAFLLSRSKQLGALSTRHAVPAIYQFREFVEAGGLLSYGSSITDSYRQLGVYTGRILNGEKPADLPVQQSTKVGLIINLKTAKLLGLEVPPTLLARADEVIE
jgi:putative tryptophan/tyrosine transport system substrate-binding protein